MRRMVTTLVLTVAVLALVTMAAWATTTAPITGADNLAAAPSAAYATTFTHVAISPQDAAPATDLTCIVAPTTHSAAVAATLTTPAPKTSVAYADVGTQASYLHEVKLESQKTIGDKVVAYTDIGGGLGSMAKA